MARPLNQPHVTARQMVEQARRNRDLARKLESSPAPQRAANSVPGELSPTFSTARRSARNY